MMADETLDDWTEEQQQCAAGMVLVLGYITT